MFRFLLLFSRHSGAGLAPHRHPFVCKDSYFSPHREVYRVQVTAPLQDNGGGDDDVGVNTARLRGNASMPIGGLNQVGRRQEPSNLPNKQETLLGGYSARARGKCNKAAFWDGSEGCFVRCSPVLAVKAFSDLFLFLSSVSSDSLLVCNVTWRVFFLKARSQMFTLFYLHSRIIVLY